jgi:hypothetical protein
MGSLTKPFYIKKSIVALLRLARAVLIEAHDAWQATDRRYLGETTMALLTSRTVRRS